MPSLTLATRIRRELRIRTVKRASGAWTEVTLREVHIPHPDDEGPPRFRLTTNLTARLSAVHFDRGLAAKVNEASREKGRALYAVDLELSEVVAAVSYHIPDDASAPLLITALAPRVDAAAAVGRLCVPMLKACVHQVSQRLGRGGPVALRTGGASAEEAKRIYGFRPGPRGKARSLSVLVQDAPALDEPPTPRR
jgi:hypothetical protein